MEVREHLAALRREGELLAAAAARTGWDTLIPTCPDWRMRDLVQHIGDVHRWAAAHVAERRTEGIRRVEEIAGPLPDDDALLDWFHHGHARLIDTLETADPDTVCWTFLPAPSPVAFWARRQAHETGIHRADAESPAGEPTSFGTDIAVDGIDELVFGFLGRPGSAPSTDRSRTLHLHAADAPGEWLIRMWPEGYEARPEHGPADCTVRASASDLYLLVWNRRRPDGMNVGGDPSVLTFWREAVQVTWGRPRRPGDRPIGSSRGPSAAGRSPSRRT